MPDSIPPSNPSQTPEDHVTVAQLSALTNMVKSQAEIQAKQGQIIEEIAVGLFGPRRTELMGGGREKRLGAIHRLDKVEADSLEALDQIQKLNTTVNRIDHAMGNGGVPAKVRINLKDRRTQIWVALITLAGTAIAAFGSYLGGVVSGGGA